MIDNYNKNIRKFGNAWLFLSLSLAIHVIDETENDFLSFYNLIGNRFKESWHLPFLTFTFSQWISGLMVLIIIALSLTVLAYRGKKIIYFLAWPYSIIMFFDGLIHIAGSIYFGFLVPGIYSAPLLIIGSMFLFYRTMKR
jgi:hypothetical protein